MPTPEAWCPSESSETPAEGLPQLVGNRIADSICSRGMEAELVTGMIRDQLLHHFSSSNWIEERDLRHLLWRATPDTGILIESTHRVMNELAEKRPAILVKRNRYRKRPGLTLGEASQIDERGFQHFTKVWIGSHTVFCLHTNGTAAEILASEVRRELGQFAPALRDRLRLLRLELFDVGPVARVEESDHHYAVDLTLAWAFVEQWRLEEHSRPTRGFKLSIVSQF